MCVKLPGMLLSTAPMLEELRMILPALTALVFFFLLLIGVGCSILAM
jgi:hypothetical protein